MARKKRLGGEGLDFGIDERPLEECLTAWGGLPLVAETYRALGVRAAVERHVQVKERQRGPSEADMVEDFALLLAAGGECLDDFDKLGQDLGLTATLGRPLASADVARTFLYRFHDEDMEKKRPQRQLAWVPDETTGLQGLDSAIVTLVREFQRRKPDVLDFTVDMDASIIESAKREAKSHYDGGRGYQPEFAIWAETMLILADEFRDGNVPAGMDPLNVVRRAFSVLSGEVMAQMKLGFRGDSACYNHELLNWLRDENRPDGPKGKIRFAISADMSKQLSAAIEALPESAWRDYRRPDGQAVAAEANEERQWAEVIYVPDGGTTKKDAEADRYLAIRIRKRQGELFADGSKVKHFAIVTNDKTTNGGEVLWWQRQKAGTIEQVHRMTQDGLGLGTLPCGRFGANAAWCRLNVLTHDLLQALKWIALPEEDRNVHPKRLRFLHFTLPARVVRSARQTWLRIARDVKQVARVVAARAALWLRPPDRAVLA